MVNCARSGKIGRGITSDRALECKEIRRYDGWIIVEGGIRIVPTSSLPTMRRLKLRE